MNKTQAIDAMRLVMRRKHMSLSTERSYCHWLKRYCAAIPSYHCTSSRNRIEKFLTSLARQRVSASTQNQAFNAILFFYREVLHQEIGNINALRAKRPEHVRSAPSRDQVSELLMIVQDAHNYPTRLIVHMLYACGLRVTEPLNIRIKDVDLDHLRLTVRDGKHHKDRVVPLPSILAGPIESQRMYARSLWERDRRNGIPVPLPGRLHRKYPSARHSLQWYWLFPAHKPCKHPRTGEMVRWRCHESNVQRAVRKAAAQMGMESLITPHVLRHAYATHVIDRGGSVRDLQSALGHKHLDTTMRYVTPDAMKVRSPIEADHDLPAIPVTVPAAR